MTTRPQRIYDVLKAATVPLTAADIAKQLGDETNPVSSDLSRMVRCVTVTDFIQRGKGKPHRLFRWTPGSFRPGTPIGYVAKAPIVVRPAPEIPTVRPRRLVQVDGREMEVVWP